MNLFNRKPYRINRNAHRVFVKWVKPIEQWTPHDSDTFLPALRSHVQASVDDTTWSIIGQDNPASDSAYRAYVERVRAQLIEEYGLQDIQDEIKVGTYHLGLLVLSWPSPEFETYPYYYRGIQLKPFQTKDETEQMHAG